MGTYLGVAFPVGVSRTLTHTMGAKAGRPARLRRLETIKFVHGAQRSAVSAYRACECYRTAVGCGLCDVVCEEDARPRSSFTRPRSFTRSQRLRDSANIAPKD